MRTACALALGLVLPAAGFDLARVIFTQVPKNSRPFGEGARIVRLNPDRTVKVLITGFHSAADPEVSFDATRILFAGKRTASEHWQIFEASTGGGNVRQLTKESFDCRHPIYQSRVFVLDSERPWYQVAFLREESNRSDWYSIHLDGSGLRRLTYNLGRNYESALMPDGRMVFGVDAPAAKGLFGINLDGTDYALFAPDHGFAMRMPMVTSKRIAVFVEAAPRASDGAGRLAAVSLRRSLHSHRVIAEGLFHSPSALPDGSLLVSKRGATHGIYRLNPDGGRLEPVFDDPNWHDVQARVVAPRDEPDGRSSVVDETVATAKLYCLSVYTTTVTGLKPGAARNVRVLADGTGALGEVALEDDGSFNIELPANTPVRLQLLDAKGRTLETTPWIWTKNKENRGCIGCHEDGERVPENRLATALTKPSARLSVHQPVSTRKEQSQNATVAHDRARLPGARDRSSAPAGVH